MATWAEIFPGLPPEAVSGRVADFDAASSETHRLATAAEDVRAEFDLVVASSDLGDLCGSTAEQLIDAVTSVDGSLGDLPPLFDALESIFVGHATRLRELNVEAAAALARADAHHLALQRAASEHQRSSAVLATIEAQIRSLQASADGVQVAQQIEELIDRRWVQSSTVGWHRARLADAETDLIASRAEYDRLVNSEQALTADTVNRIGGVDLAELRDPGRLHRLAASIVAGVAGFAEAGADGLHDGLQQLAPALLSLAEFVMAESLRSLALGIRAVLDPLVLGAALLLAWAVDAALGAPQAGSGDLGGSYSRRPTGVRGGHVGSNRAQGRQVVVEALLDTSGDGDFDAIRHDEFQVVRLQNGKFIVVLPGVIDLSSPYLGLDPGSRSARDTDQHAVPSAASASIDDNVYAQMVREAMTREHVPAGADVMLVGHSFGADTALDLAADDRFNGGPSGYNITHVVATAYDSAPQLPHVSSATAVLVLQNSFDVPVLAEHGARGPLGAITRLDDGLDHFIDRNPRAGLASIADAVTHAISSHPPVDQLRPQTVAHGPNHLQVVFAGGTRGLGHHQDNYIDYLEGTSNAAVDEFLSSVGAAGYGDAGIAQAIDVSVPSPQ